MRYGAGACGHVALGRGVDGEQAGSGKTGRYNPTPFGLIHAKGSRPEGLLIREDVSRK